MTQQQREESQALQASLELENRHLKRNLAEKEAPEAAGRSACAQEAEVEGVKFREKSMAFLLGLVGG